MQVIITCSLGFGWRMSLADCGRALAGAFLLDLEECQAAGERGQTATNSANITNITKRTC